MPSHPRLAVVMDPIQDIKFAKDSTLAMLLAASARGYELLYLEQGDLWLRDGVACGRCRSSRIRSAGSRSASRRSSGSVTSM
jgi:glutathione synthase